MSRFEVDEEIYLREFTERDADAVYTLVKANSDHLMEFMAWMKPNYSLVDAHEFIAQSIVDVRQKRSLPLGIFRSKKLIGATGYASFDREAKAAEIGYWIDKQEEGKGIVSKACEVLIDHGFKKLDLNRIQIRCAAQNIRSAAIPERFGFTLEGRLRQSVFRNGKLHDFLVFGLLRSEWEGENHA